MKPSRTKISRVFDAILILGLKGVSVTDQTNSNPSVDTNVFTRTLLDRLSSYLVFNRTPAEYTAAQAFTYADIPVVGLRIDTRISNTESETATLELVETAGTTQLLLPSTGGRIIYFPGTAITEYSLTGAISTPEAGRNRYLDLEYFLDGGTTTLTPTGASFVATPLLIDDVIAAASVVAAREFTDPDDLLNFLKANWNAVVERLGATDALA
jgi:hypothetical protein